MSINQNKFVGENYKQTLGGCQPIHFSTVLGWVYVHNTEHTWELSKTTVHSTYTILVFTLQLH